MRHSVRGVCLNGRIISYLYFVYFGARAREVRRAGVFSGISPVHPVDRCRLSVMRPGEVRVGRTRRSSLVKLDPNFLPSPQNAVLSSSGGRRSPGRSVGRSRGQPAAARTFDIGDFPLRVAAVSDFYTMTMTTADKDREREAPAGGRRREGARLIFSPGPFLHSGE